MHLDNKLSIDEEDSNHDVYFDSDDPSFFKRSPQKEQKQSRSAVQVAAAIEHMSEPK